MALSISVESLKELMQSEQEFALIDIREKPEYEKGQIFGASLVPRRMLEWRISALVPVRDTKIIVYDDEGRRSFFAAQKLNKHGYANAVYLEGGLNKWREMGFFVVEGVNVPSKAFGELVAAFENVNEIEPVEYKEWLDNNEDIVLLEVRPAEEVNRTGSIPGAINIAGVQLPLSINDYIKEGKKIVTTCAGRTRGIIAAHTLKLMGVKNVFDLKNGIQGWLLAGFELQRDIPVGPAPSTESVSKAGEFARKLAKTMGITYISVQKLKELRQVADKQTLYQLDVRTKEEYAKGHIPGSVFLPGGQALQCADENIAVRRGKIVLICDNFIRSTITAFWQMQMGFPEVYVLSGGLEAWIENGEELEKGISQDVPLGLVEAKEKVDLIDPLKLLSIIESEKNISIIYVNESKKFAEGHLKNSYWVPRGWLELRVRDVIANLESPIVVTCEDGINSIFAAEVLKENGYQNSCVLEGGIEAWSKFGLPVEDGLVGIDGDPGDVFLKPYERKTKFREAMLKYLSWEEQLVEEPEYQKYFKAYKSIKKLGCLKG
ncbi:MAG: hypothetical protein JM58_04530 [Peptococcaceae bacterium BICA1-8]|nr:MAG: hypothetical protein JM58_04530 [Peptococcaceae bacterium BICA1-8]